MNQRAKKYLSFLFLGIAGFFSIAALYSPASAEEIRLSATVDQNEISLEDAIRLSIFVHGVQNPPEPRLPSLPDFRVRSLGTSSSTRIINGQMSTTVTHNYQLTPLKTGSFVIGPARMKLAGTTYQSDPITVSVAQSAKRPAESNAPAFVETFVSNEKPFVNEQVIYTFKLYRRVDAKNLSLSMAYEDADFRKEDMGNAKVYTQVRNGVQYQVHELSSALYPIHAGAVEIPPATLELDLVNRGRSFSGRDPLSRFFDDPFFGSGASFVHKILRSDPIQVQVRPLPERGKPENFSGLVGKFQIVSALGKNQLAVGDTTTLTITVQGPGSVKELSIDPPNVEDRFKVYPDQPEFKLIQNAKTLAGEKVFKFALVPLQEGKVTLPAIALPYFDPDEKRYVTAKTNPIHLTILPSGDDESLQATESLSQKENSADKTIKILGEDILPIHSQLMDFEQKALSRSDYVTFALGMIAPPVLFFLFAGYVNYQRRLKHDVAFFRNRSAFKEANRKLKELSSSSQRNSKDLVKILSEIFREYIGNKLNLQGKAFTSLEVESKLKERNYPEEQAANTRKLLEKYEALQYTPFEFNKNEDLIDESRDLLKQLEKHA